VDTRSLAGSVAKKSGGGSSRGLSLASATENRVPSVRARGRRSAASAGPIGGCAQCAHSGLRIESYWCRTGPDSLCVRIGEFFGEVADIQRLGPGSSPTSGTCFSSSGSCELLTEYKSPLWAPTGAYSWWRLVWRFLLLLGQRYCCVLLHGRESLELHDLLPRRGLVGARLRT